MGPMPQPDPTLDLRVVIVDGSNLAFALGRDARERGEGRSVGVVRAAAVPAGAVLAALRAAFPVNIPIEVVFDGPPSGPKGRIGNGLEVRYSGRLTADRVIVERARAISESVGPAAAAGILVVTDDRGLGELVRAVGARVRGLTWLGGRLRRPTTGRPSPSGAGSGGPGPGGRGTSGVGLPRPRSGTAFGQRRPPRATPTD